MENKQTLRIYFEYGTKAKGLSFWSAFWDSRFSSKILQIAKELGIEQAICFNVS
ncbi:hypothetical protein Emtol_0284 (plasmid) [Emticicia oligotrophica DSM 17448]|uniref:Uncharacterized protein n=1 Tax=Emticicia oligotrophica (strain DSM 17448 / CIP 109782 / MTCC 6937 / GPTSA100-15) TaxID=929562 RepID=A0ABM5N7Z0_EMTOG|nr:hypothetical protein [Emticicia oligotrophica]AFK05554.1 hypothetical protein Emtol_0284 [Emticicia oligotrophica DSM 17448]